MTFVHTEYSDAALDLGPFFTGIVTGCVFTVSALQDTVNNVQYHNTFSVESFSQLLI